MFKKQMEKSIALVVSLLLATMFIFTLLSYSVSAEEIKTKIISIPFKKTVVTLNDYAANKAASEEFTINIEAQTDGMPMPSNVDSNGDMVITGPGDYSFDGIVITESDIGNTLIYEITEKDTNTDGMVYFDKTWYARIIPLYDENGEISAPVITYLENDTAKSDIEIINKYYPQSEIEVKKTVSGSGGDKKKPFDFTLTLKSGETPASGTLKYVKKSNGTVITDEHGNSEFDAVIDENGSVTFTLKNAESISFTQVPVGFTATVTENNGTYNPYINATIRPNGAPDGEKRNTISELVEFDKITENFHNVKDFTPDNGLTIQMLPFYLLSIAGCAGMVLYATITLKKKVYSDF